MYQKSDFKILSSLRGKDRSISEITEATGLARSTVSTRLQTLTDAELVEQSNDSSSAERARFHRRLTGVATAFDRATDSIPHVDLDDFLTPAQLQVIYWLDTPLSPSEIASRTDIGRVRVHQLLSTLVTRQFVTNPETGVYELRTEYRRLHRLAEELAYHKQWAEIREPFPDAIVVWAAPCEALLVPGNATRNVVEQLVEDNGEYAITGVASYHRFGLRFNVAGAPLVYRRTTGVEGQLEPSRTETVCHALSRRIEHRRLRFTAIVVLASILERDVPLSNFLSVAEIFDVRRELDALFTFLVSEGDTDRIPDDLANVFPSWDRLVDTANDYDVDTDTAVRELDRKWTR